MVQAGSVWLLRSRQWRKSWKVLEKYKDFTRTWIVQSTRTEIASPWGVCRHHPRTRSSRAYLSPTFTYTGLAPPQIIRKPLGNVPLDCLGSALWVGENWRRYRYWGISEDWWGVGKCVSSWVDQVQAVLPSSRRSQAKFMVSTFPQSQIYYIKTSLLPPCTPIYKPWWLYISSPRTRRMSVYERKRCVCCRWWYR